MNYTKEELESLYARANQRDADRIVKVFEMGLGLNFMSCHCSRMQCLEVICREEHLDFNQIEAQIKSLTKN